MCVCVCCRILFTRLLFVSFLFLLAFFMLLRYSKMQFYSCQGNLTPSAKMQALLATTRYPATMFPSPSHLAIACACHVVPAPVAPAFASSCLLVFCLATLRYFLANDEVSRYILLLLRWPFFVLFFFFFQFLELWRDGGWWARGTCIQGLGKRFSVSFSFVMLSFMHCVQSVNKRQERQ